MSQKIDACDVIMAVVSGAISLGEEMPLVGGACKTLTKIRGLVDTAGSNKEQLKALCHRCDFLLTRVVNKWIQETSPPFKPHDIVKCLGDVERLAARCNNRGLLFRFMSCAHTNDIARQIKTLNDTINQLVMDNALERIIHIYQQEPTYASAHLAAVANLPRGIPATKSWHVERQAVKEAVLEHLAPSGSVAGPRLVGLVGPSGAGKTTIAAMVVKNSDVRQHFCDGMLWLSVGENAVPRVSAVMSKLATMVWEQIFSKTEPNPVQRVVLGGDNYQDCKMGDGASEHQARNGAGYVAELMRKHEKRCLVVADNVWELGVIEELKKTGLWILFTTQQPDLAAAAGTRAIQVDQVCDAEAEQVLRHGAELQSDDRLPRAAYKIMHLCHYMVMDLAFVARWGVVRHRRDDKAWSEALRRIEQQRTRMPQASVRIAVLQAGFEQLGVENPMLKELYLSLAVLPHDLIFDSSDVAALLYEDELSEDDRETAKGLVQVLRRWAILDRQENGGYRVHEAHAMFVKERIAGHAVEREKAVILWRKHISSLEAVRSTPTNVLQKLWRAVEAVDGHLTVHPYHAKLERMDTSDPMYMSTLEAIARFCVEENDAEEASVLLKRLLDIPGGSPAGAFRSVGNRWRTCWHKGE